jgi:two-component system LytT family response regulator/two-component system response regulator LytT
MEGHSNYKTIEELQANLDRDIFWRVHRSYLVNINKIKEWSPGLNPASSSGWTTKSKPRSPVSRVQDEAVMGSWLKL